MSRRLLAVALIAVLLVVTGVGAAQVTPPSASGSAPAGTPAAPRMLIIDALPLLGPGTPSGSRWLGCVVRIYNPGDQQIEGHLELTASMPYGRDDTQLLTRAPFAVAAKGRVTLQLPTHGFAHAPPQLKARAFDSSNKLITEAEIPDPRPIEPTLFDLTVPSRIAPGLRGMRVATEYSAPLRGTYGAPTLSVAVAQVNPSTGEAALPDRAASYASATVVLVKSDALLGLGGPELDSLVHWVLGGGALAVVIVRPEDVRAPTLTALTGGEIRSVAPPKIAGATTFTVPSESGTGSYPSYGYGGSRNVSKVATPSAEVSSKLAGFAGGNLRESPWGASASYGLGEVHLLAFDATRDPFASDEWVKLKMLDLVRFAWDRQVNVALPHGASPLDATGLEGIRKQLDPNEGARWAIVVALLVLIAYAMLAGPLNFYLASKKGRPLRALWHLPIWAGATMGLVVLLGAFAKGITGRARHLSLIESGAGMSRASITRFRGFYSSAAEQLLVRASERGNVLDVAGDPNETSRQLVVDRDGARLEKFQSKPWQTVVVREDGFVSLGGGVSLVEKAGGDVEIKNRTARDLIGVFVWRPKVGLVYFARIKDGQSALASAGTKLGKPVGKLRYFGSISVRDLDADEFAPTVEADVKGAGAAWQSFDQLADRSVNWWPDDVPVLIGQLDGGEGKSSDSGLRIDTDRVLLRVVGWGGVP